MAKEGNKLRDITQRATAGDSEKSQQWYMAQIRKLGIVNPRAAFSAGIGTFTWNAMPGSMYLFHYLPRWREKLPHYDLFPLVLPYSLTDDGFYGLNLHYVRPLVRVAILDEIMAINGTKHLTDKSKIQLSWNMLQKAALHPMIKPTVKRYLQGALASRFLEIPVADWRTAVLLPVQRFVKASAESVWRANS